MQVSFSFNIRRSSIITSPLMDLFLLSSKEQAQNDHFVQVLARSLRTWSLVNHRETKLLYTDQSLQTHVVSKILSILYIDHF